MGFLMRPAARRLALAAALAFTAGCASTPYRFEEHAESDLTLALRQDETQVERGKPNAWVDGFGHYFFSLPSKLILLDWDVNDHDVSPEVERALEEYLRRNGLCNTKVRLNQYAPGGEWRRLVKNREMPGGWRFTLGVLSVSFYTIFPERLFAGFPIIGGGDHFNPYTNTISIYSDVRPIVLHEGGHAKDFGDFENRHWKGVYAGLRAIPFLGLLVALYQEAVASNDALSWELATAGSPESKAAYRTLYPAYGTYLGGAAQTGTSLFVDGWILYAVQFGVVVVGHVAGQTRALFVRDRAEGLEPELLEASAPGLHEDAVLGGAGGPPRPACPEPASVPAAAEASAAAPGSETPGSDAPATEGSDTPGADAPATDAATTDAPGADAPTTDTNAADESLGDPPL